jgi:serine/threonine protein kinase
MEKLNEFEFLKVLGQGAFSTVYHARSRRTLSDFAIKVIQKSRVKSTKQLKSLQNEISIQMSLSHPNIIQLFDHFEDTDNHYLILEYNPGCDLRTSIHREGRFSESSCKEILKQLVSAVNFLQASGIMHRDLKLANILLHKNRVQITDFGLSVKLDESQYFRETFCGTPNYISP